MRRVLLVLATVAVVATVLPACVPANPNQLPVDHVVILMQENRSADSYLGQLRAQGQPDYEAEPRTGNPDPTNPTGPAIVPFHKTTYCDVADLDHSWNGAHAEYDNGAMDGFTTTNAVAADPTGGRAMGYYDRSDLPFYYDVYSTFATSDRYFSSTLTQTFPNRMYLYAGSSYGHIRNDFHGLDVPSVFEQLDKHFVSWKIYASQYPLAYGSLFFKYVADRASQHVFPMTQYYADAAAGKLPNVAFIDPELVDTPNAENDEHPISNVQLGQKFVADVTNALMQSPNWASSAMFLTYDEDGGFYDHVAPPAAVPPDTIAPMLQLGDTPGAFDRYGFRVPMAVISPYAKAHYVSHTTYDHTSILAFLEYRFGMPALTQRDAHADPMLGLFDFTHTSFATPPTLATAVVDPAQLAACPTSSG